MNSAKVNNRWILNPPLIFIYKMAKEKYVVSNALTSIKFLSEVKSSNKFYLLSREKRRGEKAYSYSKELIIIDCYYVKANGVVSITYHKDDNKLVNKIIAMKKCGKINRSGDGYSIISYIKSLEGFKQS